MPNKDDDTQFKQWFADMQERYQQYYGGYEDLFQEAFEAGAEKEREACAALVEREWSTKLEKILCDELASYIRARGQT